MKTLLICDDDKSILEDLSLRLSHILPENWDIKTFLAPGDLRLYLETSASLPDILFMDIQFGTENGICLASDIQTRYPLDRDCIDHRISGLCQRYLYHTPRLFSCETYRYGQAYVGNRTGP